MIPVREKSIFEVIQEEEGLLEDNYVVRDLWTDVELGRVEFIHGKSLSVKAIGMNCAHEPPPEICGPPITKRQKNLLNCYLLLAADRDVGDKYRSCCQWLKRGPSVDRCDHLRDRNDIRLSYGYPAL